MKSPGPHGQREEMTAQPMKGNDVCGLYNSSQICIGQAIHDTVLPTCVGTVSASLRWGMAPAVQEAAAEADLSGRAERNSETCGAARSSVRASAVKLIRVPDLVGGRHGEQNEMIQNISMLPCFDV
jgi:hypothetical protein